MSNYDFPGKIAYSGCIKTYEVFLCHGLFWLFLLFITELQPIKCCPKINIGRKLGKAGFITECLLYFMIVIINIYRAIVFMLNRVYSRKEIILRVVLQTSNYPLS